MDTKAVIGTVIVTLGSLLIGLLTRRNTKEQTAVTGFSTLTAAQTAELLRLAGRVSTLEDGETTRRRLARDHEKWDRQVVDRLRDLTDEPFPDPPPLDV